MIPFLQLFGKRSVVGLSTQCFLKRLETETSLHDATSEKIRWILLNNCGGMFELHAEQQGTPSLVSYDLQIFKEIE